MTPTKLPSGLKKYTGVTVEEALDVIRQHSPEAHLMGGPDGLPGYVRVHTVTISRTNLPDVLRDLGKKAGQPIQELPTPPDSSIVSYVLGANYDLKGYQGVHINEAGRAEEVTFLRIRD